MSADIKVKDRVHLVRRGAAIVNTDREGYQAFIARRENELNRDREVEELKKTVAEMKKLIEMMQNEKGK